MTGGKTAVAALLLALPAVLLIGRAGKDAARVPADLRDAPNSGGAAEQLGLGDSADLPLPVPAAEYAGPAANKNKKFSGGDAGESAPFIFAELKMAPFKGRTTGETKQRVHDFSQGLGLKISMYQDNEALKAVEFIPDEAAAAGMFGKLEALARDRRIEKKLRALPGVSSATRLKTSQHEYWSVIFTEPLYEDQVKALFGNIGENFRLKDYRNPGMKGVWIDLDISGLADPQNAARRLAEAHPDKIYNARVRVRQATMRMTVR